MTITEERLEEIRKLDIVVDRCFTYYEKGICTREEALEMIVINLMSRVGVYRDALDLEDK